MFPSRFFPKRHFAGRFFAPPATRVLEGYTRGGDMIVIPFATFDILLNEEIVYSGVSDGLGHYSVEVPFGFDDEYTVVVTGHGEGITLLGGRIEGRGKKKRHQPVPGEEGEVIAQTLFANLTEKYGAHTGEYIYWKMVEERKGPFQPGAKYAGGKRH